MTITINNNKCITEYTDKEWDFIDSLDTDVRKKVLRGLISIYDLGYTD